MLCTKCKSELPDGSQFCLKCGHSQKVTAPKIASPVRTFGYVLLGVAIAAAGFIAWRIVIARASTVVQQPQVQSQSSAVQTASVSASANAVTSVPKPRILSAQEIFQRANGSMALIETFDEEGHPLEQGSGFIVSSDGAVLTNYHVIRGASRAEAKFGDGTTSEVGGVLAFDRAHDVAVIKLVSPVDAVLHLGDSDKVRVGEKIVAIGSPLGFQNTVSEGIVSGLRNGIIQMSNPISPGSSGGAVLDRYGNVIGISVATITAGQNLNFAVPINWAKAYLSGGNPQSFADVIAENTVTNDLLDGSMTVPAQQFKTWPLMVNPNAMNDVEVVGQVTSTGGMDGQITLALYHQGESQPIYSCRSTTCAIDKKLPASGMYAVTLDNRPSPLFGRTVTGKLAEKYVH
jgi:Trypsin-like peptidase domain